jgi:V-type H+-transporting ATPase subunit D
VPKPKFILRAMSSGGQRPPANRMTLQTFKARLNGAKKGHSLLKKKRDALKARFHQILKEIVDTKLKAGEGLKEAGFSFAKAQWANSGDDFSSTVIERAKRATVLCKLTGDNVAGVQLPKFTCNHDPTKDTSVQTLGVAHGGAVLDRCRQEYLKAIKCMIDLASLQTAFKTLDEEIKMTSRRVNALEYVLIPRIEVVCHYITQEMDEEAREEFFRVKKVVEKKKAKLAKEFAENAKEEAGKKFSSPMDAPSALPSTKDSDLVF